MATNATRVVGPAVGGILIVAFGAAGKFLLQSALYLCMVAHFPDESAVPRHCISQ